MPETSRIPAGIDLRPFDPLTASRADWDQLHAYRRLRQQEDHPGEPLPPDADFEHQLLQPQPLFEARRIIAMRGGAYVGNLVLGFRRPGSPDSADHAGFIDAGGGVPLALRRQGIGTALLAALLGFMQDNGRTTATARAQLPDGHAFLRAFGAQQKYRAVENRLALDGLRWDELARWQAEASAHGLRWEVHAGRVPFSRLAQLMEPLTQLINEQPLDALDIPRIRYELQGYETWYADMDRRGGTHFLVLLMHGDEVAAVCDASWDGRFPDRAWQQLTAVAAPWRGKGLAKAAKAALLHLLRQHHPGVRTVVTHNANSNAAMLSINRRLGFAVHRETATYQVTADTLAATLSALSLR